MSTVPAVPSGINLVLFSEGMGWYMETTSDHHFILRKSPVTGTIVLGVPLRPDLMGAYYSSLEEHEIKAANALGLTVWNWDIHKSEKEKGYIDFFPMKDQLHLF